MVCALEVSWHICSPAFLSTPLISRDISLSQAQFCLSQCCLVFMSLSGSLLPERYYPCLSVHTKIHLPSSLFPSPQSTQIFWSSFTSLSYFMYFLYNPPVLSTMLVAKQRFIGLPMFPGLACLSTSSNMLYLTAP